LNYQEIKIDEVKKMHISPTRFNYSTKTLGFPEVGCSPMSKGSNYEYLSNNNGCS